MNCLTHLNNLFNSGYVYSPFVLAFNILVGILNISGNSILIWALRRTGQTKTISFQFIAIMSCSDLTIGIIGLVCISLMISLEKYRKNCWLMIITIVVLNNFNYFSAFMIFLIALDRYLHMKYLERYSTKFTKKRGYLLVIMSFVMALSTSIIFALPLSQHTYGILQKILASIAILFLISVLLLYHRALRILRRKTHQITRSIINQNRALGKAAKRVSICFLILTGPTILCHILDAVNKQLAIIDTSVLGSWFWIAYITLLANGFCSSIIFISQNIRIRRLLKGVVMGYCTRVHPTVGASEAQK